MEANLYTFLHFVRSVFTSMPVGLQVCVMYSFSSLLIVTLVLMIARCIAAPPKLVVDRPLAEAQLPRDLPHWYLVPPHGFQLVTLLLRHVVLLPHLPVPPQ